MQTQLTLFGNTEKISRKITNEYFFLISPDDHTRTQVGLLKEKLHQRISISPENLWSIAHLSLFKYQVLDNCDGLMTSLSDHVLKNIKSFNVKLNGSEIYSDSATTKSLVLKVKNPEPVRALYRTLAEGLNLSLREFHPHIAIARSVPANKFNKVSPFMNAFDYKGEFVCSKLTILKKIIEGEDNKRYKKLHEINLAG